MRFATKPELAGQMIVDALDAGVPAGWVTADEVYGDNRALRARLRACGVDYVLAVGCDTRLKLLGGPCRADVLADRLPRHAWQRRSAGAGAKGPRRYDWAWVELPAGGDDRWLLVRRNPHTGELAYYLCWSDRPQPVTALISVAGRRWAIEETFQAAKSQVGLDHYQVRGWTSWHRFVTLTMVALAFLAVLAASQPPAPAAASASTPPRALRDPDLPDLPHPIPFTLAELRPLIAHLVIRPILDRKHLLAWSTWRRRHQARARHCHYRRRLQL